jgi:hypothetical protein
MLSCAGGTYEAITCRGGCTAAACDWTMAASGDRCLETAQLCSRDRKMRLACIAFPGVANQTPTFLGEPCLGPRGCHDDVCEAPKIGDPCDGTVKVTCIVGALLQCAEGTWAASRTCRHQCGSEPHAYCDVSTSDVGDACRAEEEGRRSCSSDAKRITRCAGGHFVDDAPCAGGKSCWNLRERTEADMIRYAEYSVVAPLPECR